MPKTTIGTGIKTCTTQHSNPRIPTTRLDKKKPLIGKASEPRTPPNRKPETQNGTTSQPAPPIDIAVTMALSAQLRLATTTDMLATFTVFSSF
jgi:hypothetical protein